jgi:methyltransferase (TIGR00027 family)
MEKGRSSETAVLSAMLRAAHPLLDSKPWILEDEFAASLVGIDSAAALFAALTCLEDELTEQFPAKLVEAWMTSTRAYVTLRSRYAEGELDKAIARGISQYVILGSGFDSFAFRRRNLESGLNVFEVDYPATQHRKQGRLTELGLERPPHLRFVSLDFEQQPILEGLEESGYCLQEPAFFSWLGVAGYLSEEAIVRTLQQVASAANGSELVLNYMVPEAMLLEEEDRQIVRMLESLTAARGEPVRTYFDPVRLAALARESGFTYVQTLGPDELDARYLLANRIDGLRFTPRMRLLKAGVDRTGTASNI